MDQVNAENGEALRADTDFRHPVCRRRGPCRNVEREQFGLPPVVRRCPTGPGYGERYYDDPDCETAHWHFSLSYTYGLCVSRL